MRTNSTRNEVVSASRRSPRWSRYRLGGLSGVAFAICFFCYLTLVDVPDVSTTRQATIAFYQNPSNAVGPIVSVYVGAAAAALFLTFMLALAADLRRRDRRTARSTLICSGTVFVALQIVEPIVARVGNQHIGRGAPVELAPVDRYVELARFCWRVADQRELGLARHRIAGEPDRLAVECPLALGLLVRRAIGEAKTEVPVLFEQEAAAHFHLMNLVGACHRLLRRYGSCRSRCEEERDHRTSTPAAIEQSMCAMPSPPVPSYG